MSERLSNKDIVVELKEALAAMEINNENRFSIRAYQNVIAAVDGLTISVYDLWENNRLDEIVGVGPALKAHLVELMETSKVTEWITKKKDLPEGMFPLLVLRGVGAKTAYKLANEFKIKSRDNALEIVKDAAKSKKIQQMPGFGEKSEKDILDSIEDLKKSKNEKERMLLSDAEKISERVITHLKSNPDVIDAVPLGSFRRRKSTIGDLDIAISSKNPEGVIKHFVKFEEVKNIESEGDRMSTVILGNDVQVDVLVSDEDSFGSMLQHFTGSKQHNIKLRQYSLEQKKSLSQYGIKHKGELQKFADEKKFYKYLGLDWVPPEIREGKNEIELAAKGNLPKLITREAIKGDLHTHTIASDGINTLAEMASAAEKLGYKYYGVADHAPSVQSRGKFEVLKIMEETRRRIDTYNKSHDLKVLYGYEVNILKDKSLGMSDDLLEKLDYVIAAVHTSFGMEREEITDRVIAAIENPYVDIIGHPTGRLINAREPMDLDWNKIFDAIKKNDKTLEINSQPDRRDLPDYLVHEALNMDIKLIINTDAHSIDSLDFMDYGIDVARRGWCEEKDIINTLPYDQFFKKLKGNRLKS